MSLYPAATLYPGATVYPGVADGGSSPIVGPEPAVTAHEWSAFARAGDYSISMGLPIQQVQLVVRHLGAGRAVVSTPYSVDAWEALAPTGGVVLYRDGRQEFTGLVESRELNWDAESGQVTIKVGCVSDEVHLADRLAFPDPLRAADDQTVNDYWTSGTVAASTAMWQLISDTVGPTVRVDRRVPGLVMGDDPNVGTVRNYRGLFEPADVLLALISAASGANLGVRVNTEPDQLEVGIYAPRDLSASVLFSADLGNLTGLKFAEAVPGTTNAVAAGQGDLKLRQRRKAATTDPLHTRWGRQRWQYVDRRDTADTAELLLAAQDAVAEGGANALSLSLTMVDSQGARYGRDWVLGDKVTVYVGLPGATKVATVSDVVREIAWDVGADGVESMRPVVGSFDARDLATPVQRQLAQVGRQVGGLIAHK